MNAPTRIREKELIFMEDWVNAGMDAKGVPLRELNRNGSVTRLQKTVLCSSEISLQTGLCISDSLKCK